MPKYVLLLFNIDYRYFGDYSDHHHDSGLAKNQIWKIWRAKLFEYQALR
jgi:hypothetical protein